MPAGCSALANFPYAATLSLITLIVLNVGGDRCSSSIFRVRF